MISNTKFAATAIIVGGAALAGAMVCWELGPSRFELSSHQLALLGAGTSALVALVGCFFSIERSEAHTRNRDSILRLEWMLFRHGEKASAAEATPAPQEAFRPESAQAVHRSDFDGELAAEGMQLR